MSVYLCMCYKNDKRGGMNGGESWLLIILTSARANEILPIYCIYSQTSRYILF